MFFAQWLCHGHPILLPSCSLKYCQTQQVTAPTTKLTKTTPCLSSMPTASQQHQQANSSLTSPAGCVIQPSCCGGTNRHMLVLYSYDSNNIHVEPIRTSLAGPKILATYQRA
jgi:hypothetical protein